MDNILDSHVGAYEGTNLYDFDNNIQMDWYPKRVIEHTKNLTSMLELGLGHGISTDLFSAHFDRYLVIDASKAVIDNFHKKFPESNVEIVDRLKSKGLQFAVDATSLENQTEKLKGLIFVVSGVFLVLCACWWLLTLPFCS